MHDCANSGSTIATVILLLICIWGVNDITVDMIGRPLRKRWLDCEITDADEIC